MSDENLRADEDLLVRLEGGDERAMTELFTRHRERLRRMIRLRLDRRLQGRIDLSDVLQDSYLEVARRAREYLAQANMPPFLWLRLMTGQTLQALHRHHLKVQMRDAGQEVSLRGRATPQANSACLAEMLLGRLTSPTRAARRAEMQLKLQEILNAMEPLDREILALRHFEELSNAEIAQVLDLTKTAASNRYIRAFDGSKSGSRACPDFSTSRRGTMDSDAIPSGLDPLEPLAEEFLRRRRRGERPTPAEYVARYPEHAERILELFPAFELLEGLKPTPEEDAGPSAAPGGTAQRASNASRGGWETTHSSASSAAAAWASSTKPSTSRSRAAWQ